MIIDVTNFGVGEHTSNIKIADLNITKLSTYIKKLILFIIFLFNYLLNPFLGCFIDLWFAVHIKCC